MADSTLLHIGDIVETPRFAAEIRSLPYRTRGVEKILIRKIGVRAANIEITLDKLLKEGKVYTRKVQKETLETGKILEAVNSLTRYEIEGHHGYGDGGPTMEPYNNGDYVYFDDIITAIYELAK